ncbi:MAG: twin-arginine translocase TatA/TatE family subunit [Pseudomonadota bacterium]
MGAFSIWHWVIVLAIVLVLFGGGGKISRMMGDLGSGLKAFRKNVKEQPTAGTPQEQLGDKDSNPSTKREASEG